MADEHDTKVVFGGDAKEAESAVKKIIESIEGLKAPIVNAIGQFKELAEIVGATWAVEKISAFIEKLEDMGTMALRLSAVLGMSVEAVSNFSNQMMVVGGAAGQTTIRTMEHLQRVMSEALVDPASHAAAAFKNLGVSSADLKKNLADPERMLEQLRGSFNRFQNDANKTANFYLVLGRAYDNLVPYLRLSDEEVEKLNKHLKETGANVAPFAERLFHSGEVLRLLEKSLTGVSLAIYGIVQPAMDAFLEFLTRNSQRTRELIVDIEEFVRHSPSIASVGDAFGTIPGSINSVIEAVKRLAQAFNDGKIISWSSEFEKLAEFARNTAREISAIAAAFEQAAAFVVKLDETLKAQAASQSAIRDAQQKEEQIRRQRDHIAANEGHKDYVANLAKANAALDAAHARTVAAEAILTDRLKDINDRYFRTTEGAWSDHASRINAIQDSIGNNAPAPGRGRAGGAGVTEPPAPPELPRTAPPPHGAGGGGHPPPSYMQDWREALERRLMEEKKFFATSKEEELAYWTEKHSYVVSHEAEIVAAYIAAGQKKDVAQKSFKALEFQTLQQTYNLQKEEANRGLSEYKSHLSTQLADLKANLADKTITETEWFTQSLALQKAYQAKLKALGLEGTAHFEEAQRQELAIVKEHSNNMMAEWASMFSWFNNKLDAMVTGILQGTQTWRQAMRHAFTDMATAFIVEVAKMTLRWLAFKALTLIGAGGMAKSVGNPFAQLAGSIGTATGGGQGGGGNKPLQHAMTALTAATTLNSLATKDNSTGLLGMIGQGIQWVATQLGLTAATQSAEVANMGSRAASIISSVSDDGNTVATDALTVVMAMQAAKPYATGAWKLPYDTPATVHAGEMIIPAKEAEMIRSGTGGMNMLAAMFGKTSMLRQMQGTMADLSGSSAGDMLGAAFPDSSGGGGGGGVMAMLKEAAGGGGGNQQAVHVSFSVNALDAGSVHSFFQKHSGAIATAVSSEIRNANSAMNRAGRMASSAG